jgi:hypothetical protein
MRGIGPRISDRHYDMLKVLEGYFESQRGALERVIEDGYRYYITEMRANGSQGHQADEADKATIAVYAFGPDVYPDQAPLQTATCSAREARARANELLQQNKAAFYATISAPDGSHEVIEFIAADGNGKESDDS